MNIELTKEQKQQTDKTPQQLDLEYLKDSIDYNNNQLKALRYSIKEIKVCVVTATADKNTGRITVLRQQKAKVNELIKAAMTDLKRIGSIYKVYLRSMRKV